MVQDKTQILVTEFYKKLGTLGMTSLTNEKRDIGSIKFVLPFFKKSDRILDLACGYGRITFPLAKKGFNIFGIDISPNLIKYARINNNRQNLKIDFKIGDMRNLSYENNSFDKIICLWSSFNHILEEKDQILVLNEIYRILSLGGIVLMDLPNGESKWAKEQIRKYGRLVPDVINDIKIINYLHDRETLKNLGEKTKFKQIVKFLNIAGRRRIIWILKKE